MLSAMIEDKSCLIQEREGVVAVPLPTLARTEFADWTLEPLFKPSFVEGQVESSEQQVAGLQSIVLKYQNDATEAMALLGDARAQLGAWRECLNLPVQDVYRFYSVWREDAAFLPKDEYDRDEAVQKVSPVWLAGTRGRGWWWYLDRFWSHNEGLEASDVQALVQRSDEPGEDTDERIVARVPRELLEDFSEAVLHFGRLAVNLRRVSQLSAEDAENQRLGEEEVAAQSEHDSAWTRVREAELSIIDFCVANEIYYDRWTPRPPQAAFSLGNFDVELTGTPSNDDYLAPDEEALFQWNMDKAVNAYTVARLGCASGIIFIDSDQGRLTVLHGVSFEDAAHVKDELEQLFAHAEVVEISAPSVVQEGGDELAAVDSVEQEVWRRDAGRCIDCGSTENLGFDYIIPVNQGGSRSARNMQLRCESCSSKRPALI